MTMNFKPEQKLNNAGKPLPDIGLKWGKTPGPKNEGNTGPDTNDTLLMSSSSASSTSPLTQDTRSQPDWENYYTEEEKEKLRKKGINPALKAEMEASKKQQEGKGFWGKLSQTTMGGGVIK